MFGRLSGNEHFSTIWVIFQSVLLNKATLKNLHIKEYQHFNRCGTMLVMITLYYLNF
jgi:hypothetical protein